MDNVIFDQLIKNQKKLSRRVTLLTFAICGYVLYKIKAEKENTK